MPSEIGWGCLFSPDIYAAGDQPDIMSATSTLSGLANSGSARLLPSRPAPLPEKSCSGSLGEVRQIKGNSHLELHQHTEKSSRTFLQGGCCPRSAVTGCLLAVGLDLPEKTEAVKAGMGARGGHGAGGQNRCCSHAETGLQCGVVGISTCFLPLSNRCGPSYLCDLQPLHVSMLGITESDLLVPLNRTCHITAAAVVVVGMAAAAVAATAATASLIPA